MSYLAWQGGLIVLHGASQERAPSHYPYQVERGVCVCVGVCGGVCMLVWVWVWCVWCVWVIVCAWWCVVWFFVFVCGLLLRYVCVCVSVKGAPISLYVCVCVFVSV